MNFKIVEQASDNSKYEAFKELYCNSDLKVDEICRELGISSGKACRFANEYYRESGWRRRMKGRVSGAKYYTKKKGWGYEVKRRINNQLVLFGTYKNEKTAKQVVEELKKVDWDKKELPFIKKKLGVKK